MAKITIDTDNLDYWIKYLLIKKYSILDEETTEKLIYNITNDRMYNWSIRKLAYMLGEYPFFMTIAHGFVKNGVPEGKEFWINIYNECLYQEFRPYMFLDKETFLKFRANWLKYDEIQTDNNLYNNFKKRGLKPMLASNFPWEDTPEGYDFWHDLYYSL